MPFLFTKQLARRVLAALYYATGSYRKIHSGRLLVLTYHRILPGTDIRKGLLQPGMYVKEGAFEKHLRFLKQYYTIISLSEYLDRREKADWERSRQYAIITFDDGWKDNYDYAFPLLKKYALPATIFPATDYIGSNQRFWPDRLSRCLSFLNAANLPLFRQSIETIQAQLPMSGNIGRLLRQITVPVTIAQADCLIEEMKALPRYGIDQLIAQMEKRLQIPLPAAERVMLSWEEIEEMSSHSISFGSHGCSHELLTLLAGSEIRKELQQSKEVLSEKAVNDVPVFCFPNGNYNDQILEMVQSVDYRIAMTQDRGLNPLTGRLPFCLKRIGVHHDISPNQYMLALHLSGWIDRLNN